MVEVGGKRSRAYTKMLWIHKKNTISRKTSVPAAEMKPHEHLQEIVRAATTEDMLPSIETYAAIHKSLIGACIASGYTESNLSAATIRIISGEYEDADPINTGRKKLKARSKFSQRVRVALVAVALLIIVAIPLSQITPHPSPASITTQVAKVNEVSDTRYTCDIQTHERYSGRRAAIEDVARAYHEASEKAVECSNKTSDDEERAEFLLAAAGDASLECGIETNYDHRSASETYSRAVALATRARDLTKQRDIRGEATEIIRQLRDTPSDSSAPLVPGVPLDINANASK